MSHDDGTPKVKFDPSSKLGRAVFQMVDASQKMNAEIRTRVARVRNAIEAAPGDPMTRFKVDGDLATLMRESRLNPIVRAIRKAMTK
ncbi:MAG: hypothetical protein KAY61_02130 [Candidatus Eisenbacteria bacterium]|jgi:hypothetical protein|nr:hypothetical protein [Candidatus Eisenbacteria bacterium]MBP8136976.1 hypothetical protein [Candidatus Eisenbacteria bacterium]